MEKTLAQDIGEVVRQELEARQLTFCQLNRALRAKGRQTAAQRLTDDKIAKLPLGSLGDIFEVTAMDPGACFGLATGSLLPTASLLEQLQTRDEPGWTRGQNITLTRVAGCHLRGTAGFHLFRSELRRIEVLREDDPEAAELLAWQALEQACRSGNAGGTAGALVVLAGGYPRAKAQPLFKLAFTILGEKPEGLLAGKAFSGLARFLITAGYADQARALLKYRAWPEVSFFGDGDEKALALMNLAKAAGASGDPDLALLSLEQAASQGGERLRFLALQLLAVAVLNHGQDLGYAARLYDELLALPQFEKAPRPARAQMKCSRLAAHFAAGQLPADSMEEYELAFAEAKATVNPTAQVEIALDFALYLRTSGHTRKAEEVLKAELWNVLGLEEGDAHIRKAYVEACSAIGPIGAPYLDVLRNR